MAIFQQQNILLFILDRWNAYSNVPSDTLKFELEEQFGKYSNKGQWIILICLLCHEFTDAFKNKLQNPKITDI